MTKYLTALFLLVATPAFAHIQLRANASFTKISSGTTCTTTLPANIQNGDLIVAKFLGNGTTTTNSISGAAGAFTLQASSNTTDFDAVWTRVASGETGGATITVTLGTAVGGRAECSLKVFYDDTGVSLSAGAASAADTASAALKCQTGVAAPTLSVTVGDAIDLDARCGTVNSLILSDTPTGKTPAASNPGPNVTIQDYANVFASAYNIQVATSATGPPPLMTSYNNATTSWQYAEIVVHGGALTGVVIRGACGTDGTTTPIAANWAVYVPGSTSAPACNGTTTIVAGDPITVAIFEKGGTASPPDATWTQECTDSSGGGGTLTVWLHTATNSEPTTTWTFHLSAGVTAAAAIAGEFHTTVVGSSVTINKVVCNGQSATSSTMPSITPASADDTIYGGSMIVAGTGHDMTAVQNYEGINYEAQNRTPYFYQIGHKRALVSGSITPPSVTVDNSAATEVFENFFADISVIAPHGHGASTMFF